MLASVEANAILPFIAQQTKEFVDKCVNSNNVLKPTIEECFAATVIVDISG